MTKRYISPQSGPVDIKTDKDSHTPRTGHTEAAGRQNEAYTPTTEEVRDNYDPECAPRFADYFSRSQTFSRLEQPEDLWDAIRDEFDRWLRTVKAEAWAEGQQRGWMDAMESVQADTAVSRALAGMSPNPYRSEEA
jgi:hypothetical protein